MIYIDDLCEQIHIKEGKGGEKWASRKNRDYSQIKYYHKLDKRYDQLLFKQPWSLSIGDSKLLNIY